VRAGGPLPTTVWLERHIASAPDTLATRVREYAASVRDEGDPAITLAAAGDKALAGVLAHSGDRSVALDLLAADALITLALLAAAEIVPERLGEFAHGLLEMHLLHR
jgi:hypothetical protein